MINLKKQDIKLLMMNNNMIAIKMKKIFYIIKILKIIFFKQKKWIIHSKKFLIKSNKIKNHKIR